MSPLAIAASMRGKSCITRRPAPMLRCPTSELPICPSGRPTSLPEVRNKACGQVAHRWSKLGVRAWRIALSATSSRQPQPSSTTSMTGRRFCMFPYPLCRASAGEIAAAGNDRSSAVCVRLQPHRQPARSLACARVDADRAFRVTPACNSSLRLSIIVPSWSAGRSSPIFAAELNKDGERIHFTFFVSASNFIADTSRNIYEGPHQRCGYSRINFGGTPEQIRKRVDYLNALYRSGHEIASHAVGHFNGRSWSASDWDKEFRAFGQILKNRGAEQWASRREI